MLLVIVFFIAGCATRRQRTPPAQIEEKKDKVLALDGFDSKLSLDWQILNPDSSHFSLSKNRGMLTITTQEGDFSPSDYKNLFLVDCPAAAGGDLQITTCILHFEPVADWNQAGLICYNDDDNYLKFVYEWSVDQRILTVGCATEGRSPLVRFRADSHFERVWLRVIKQDNHYTFFTSLDGESFLQRRTPISDETGLFQDDLLWGDGSVKKIGLFAQNGPSFLSPEIEASFDFFEVRAIPAKGKNKGWK